MFTQSLPRLVRAAALATGVGSAILANTAAGHAQDADMLFVLDLSNSMWGQIDGTAKVEIARQAFSSFLNELPDGTSAGLMAYGHRKKADCGDVELLTPISPIDRGQMQERLATLKPRGKTPITESLRQAAAELSARGGPGRLVLISDGIETCKGDPCALAEEIAKSGIDFQAHVIGFDIASRSDQARIACIAHLTGGTYWNARDAGGLAKALQETTVVREEPVTLTGVRLLAADKLSRAPINGPADWVIVRGEDETVVSSGLRGGAIELELEAGTYTVTAEFEGKIGGTQIEVTDQALEQTILLAGELPSAKVTPAKPDAPATSFLEVAFEGPVEEGDYLRVIDGNGNRLERDSWESVASGSPVELQLPTIPGDYAIAYVWAAGNDKVLATASITVTEGSATLDHEGEAQAGASFPITWTGPAAPDDWIAIIPAGGGAADYDGRWESTVAGSPVSLQAPQNEGAYEVIYVSGFDRTILARSGLKVVAGGASVSAVPSAEAGSMIEVTWFGPKGPSDWVGIAKTGAAAGDTVTWDSPHSETLRLAVPVEAGAYELRYVLSSPEGAKVLAKRALEVTSPQITLKAPDKAPAGSTVTIAAAGPANGSNWIGFAHPSQAPGETASGAWESANTISEGKVTVPTPAEPGTYELRFVLSGSTRVVAARQTVIVE